MRLFLQFLKNVEEMTRTGICAYAQSVGLRSREPTGQYRQVTKKQNSKRCSVFLVNDLINNPKRHDNLKFTC